MEFVDILKNSAKGLRGPGHDGGGIRSNTQDHNKWHFYEKILVPFIGKFGQDPLFANVIGDDEGCIDVEFFRYEFNGVEIVATPEKSYEEAEQEYRDAILDSMFADLLQLRDFEERFGYKLQIYSFSHGGVGVNPYTFEPYAKYNVRYRLEKLEY